MANVEVVEVEFPSQLKRFIKYPNQLYKGEANYVPHLLVERNEFFDKNKNPFYNTARVKLFLAMRNKEVVGRIATCINFRHNDFHHENVGFFGFFDTPDDWEVAHALLKVAMITLKKEGMDKMRGPMNFSTNHECGFLVEGFDSPPMVMMTFNYPYQVRLAEKFGLKKVMDLIAYHMSSEKGIPERIQKVVDRAKRRSNLTIRSINMSKFKSELDKIKEIYNSAWANNWGFVPMDESEFAYMAENLKQIIDPKLVFIVEDNDKPVAFSLALPDINKALIKLNGKLFPFGILKLLWHTKISNKVKSLRMVTFGVIPEYQKRSIDSILFAETFNVGVNRGYHEAELSWILENNELMRSGSEAMGAEIYKRYRIVEMPL